MIRRRLRIIRFASWFHISLGGSILVFTALGLEMPRPFGSMEAYLQYVPAWIMGAGFVLAGAASAFALRTKSKNLWLPIVLVVPQQIILLWGVLWGVAILLNTAFAGHAFDIRTWLGLCQLSGLSWFHGRDLYDVWTRTWGGNGQL